ncbi:MAG TPA: Zn-dependent hydrolase [Candidatus Tectomicrobia bacterium]|nr:Zn-dependent hydrolase [Candidatus Tectomicrobia bacterium]
MIHIDLPRLQRDLEELGEIGKTPEGGVWRSSFSDADMEARRWYLKRVEEAGLQHWVDAAGNIYARVGEGSPAVLAGSHLDSVPNGGRFDGALGVMAAFECLRSIREQGLRTKLPIEVVAFTDEEGRFGGFVGSFAVIGTMTYEEVLRRRDLRGVPLAEAMRQVGFDPARISAARRDPQDIKAYLELHIEQGPILESIGVPIGVVQGIVAGSRTWITFRGRADHAGTTPMAMRQDAFLGAAEFGLRAREMVLTEGSGTTVGTVGVVDLKPGASNIVPEIAFLTLDLRDISWDVLQRLLERVHTLAHEIAQKWGLEVTIERMRISEPALMSPRIQAVIDEVARDLDQKTHWMNSGAGHDAQVMAKITEAGMIFVPSRQGRSHSPAEFTDWEHIERGANVLLHSLLRLANE